MVIKCPNFALVVLQLQILRARFQAAAHRSPCRLNLMSACQPHDSGHLKAYF